MRNAVAAEFAHARRPMMPDRHEVKYASRHATVTRKVLCHAQFLLAFFA